VNRQSIQFITYVINRLHVTVLGPVHTTNNVESTFNFVKRLVRLVAFDNVASTLLRVWTGL